MLTRCLQVTMTAGWALLLMQSVPVHGQAQIIRKITKSGVSGTSIGTALGPDLGVQAHEINTANIEGSDTKDSGGAQLDRTLPGEPVLGPATASGHKAKSNPVQNLSFTGLNHRQQRLANGGNQFSIEPPDQGLCAGNNYVMEVVNTVLNIFDTTGHSVLPTALDLNTFYGYVAEFNRTTGFVGPEITDPSCYFDADTQRWFIVVLTLDTDGNGLTGPNHLDLAVSDTSSPLGTFTLYKIPTQDNGTEGTPDHHCDDILDFCFGDYPHIGADANGIYLTTNEFSLVTGEFHGSQIYAISKKQLAAQANSINLVQIDTLDPALTLDGNPGFTVWPATSPGGIYATDNKGTEYLLSSTAVFNDPNIDNRLRLWTVGNTQSLSNNPAVTLSTAVINVGTYGRPPKATQKAGDFPLGQCLNSAVCATNIILGFPDPFAPNPVYHLDSNDSRMQQVVFANGKLWAALDTALLINNKNQAGVAWYVINPITPKVVTQGYLGLEDTNLIYPAVGVTPSGRGVIAFTLAGTGDFPSAAYSSLDANTGAGPVTVAGGGAGAGPADGFSGYPIFAALSGVSFRPRWGDYGATAADGNSLWIASEFIGQSCTLQTYLTSPIGSCGATRTSLANWATRITKLTP